MKVLSSVIASRIKYSSRNGTDCSGTDVIDLVRSGSQPRNVVTAYFSTEMGFDQVPNFTTTNKRIKNAGAYQKKNCRAEHQQFRVGAIRIDKPLNDSWCRVELHKNE